MPKKRRTVTNASPLIYLGQVGKIHILKELYNQIQIPKEVFVELCETKETPDSLLIHKAVDEGWIKVSPNTITDAIRLSERSGIHLGESAAILLAKEQDALLLIDDKMGRTTAEIFGLECVGTVGALLIALSKQVIKLKEMTAILDRMLDCGFRLETKVYRTVLQLAKEITKSK